MPKRPPRNAFYYFMLEFRDMEKSKGITFPGGLKEVAIEASPSWVNLTAPEKAKYENMAKEANINTVKLTCTGIPLSQFEQERKDKELLEANEKKDIQLFVKQKYYDRNVNDEVIYLMDVNYYCIHTYGYIIGEYTVIRFNLQDGIRDQYHEMINADRIPRGYTSDVKIQCKENGLEMPDDSDPPPNYLRTLAILVDYLKNKQPEGKPLPPIFTMPDKVAPVQNFIKQMCSRACEDDSIFRIYKLDTLFFTLINQVKSRTDVGFPRESLALTLLKKDPYRYTGIVCERHEAVDKAVECTTARTKRWAFTILEHCCPLVGIDMEPGKHKPVEYDTGSIRCKYNERNIVRAGPSVAGHDMGESSSLDSSLEDIATESAPRQSRTQPKPSTPRMPKRNYSTPKRIPPEITESKPPALMAGRGRGRILAYVNQMKLNK